METRKGSDGRDYKVTAGGTWYDNRAQDDLIAVLERAREAGTRIIVRRGYQTQADADAAGLGGVVGRDWLEEFESEGRIGRSTGSIKVPLLIHNGRSRGGTLGEGTTVRVATTTGRTLWQHPAYHRPELTPGAPREEDRAAGYVEAVYAGGELHAQFTKAGGAAKFIQKMTR